jgi:hypothetical protein
MYKMLLKFRQDIQKAISEYGILLEGKALEVTFVTYLKKNMNLDFVDDILAPLLNPKNLQYTRQALILNYEYPDVNLGKIDFEYRMDLFEDF